MSAAAQVLSWWVLFAGTHTALSHPPVRSALVGRLGERAFQGLYSLVALATFVPLMWTFFSSRTPRGIALTSWLTVPGLRWVTMALMLIAVTLLVLGVIGPSPVGMVTGGSIRASGALRITRHPVFMALGIFGLAHLLVNHAPIDRTFFGGMLAYALLGSAHQDWRKRQSADGEMKRFFAETSFLPFVAIATGRTTLDWRELRPAAIVSALVVFAVIFAFHHRLFA